MGVRAAVAGVSLAVVAATGILAPASPAVSDPLPAGAVSDPLPAGQARVAEPDYRPDPQSLATHRTPQWFKDAKLGFFIHWGPYSVPAFAPDGGGARPGSDVYAEWYWYEMNHPGSPTNRHHAETYGEDFPYDRFVEQWRAERFNPREWLDLFTEGGAKYFVMVAKHHDGVALWDTATTDRDTVALGPHPGANDDKQRQPGPMSIVDGRARVAGGGVTLAKEGAQWTDYSFELTVRPTTRGAGWMFRSPDRNNGYMWQLYPGTGLTPHILENGSFRKLTSTIPLPVTAGQDYRVRMELDGATIRTFVDGELVDERVDTTFSSGTVGFREASNEVGEFDDVLVTDAATGATLLADDFSAGLSQWDNDSMAEYLVLDLARDARVWVAFDQRGAPEAGNWWPAWLDELGFQRTELTVRTNDPSGTTMVVLAADLPAGRVALGPNAATSSQATSYFTIVAERGAG